LQTASVLVILCAMEFLSVNHSNFLIIMSCIVALVAGFTGLSLTRDLAEKPVFQKKASIALASIALGGGIWAMHFVAMLGLKLPILFYYDAALTLVSALSAILIVGAALILLHFTHRTPLIISVAGSIVGVGVLMMHYIGMAGLELCRAIYTPAGVVFSSIVAIGLCILAFWVAYGKRTNRNIVLGTFCFAAAVCAVHFLAISQTRFMQSPSAAEFGPMMSNETLALGVIFFSFVIFGACLWVSVTYLVAPDPVEPDLGEPDFIEADLVEPDLVESGPAQAHARADPKPAAPKPTDARHTEHPPSDLSIPCESEGSKLFVRARDILFVRADGHYTQIYTANDRLFCVWPITVASKRLLPLGFLQTHRSYLVNPARVSRFERTKDKGHCLFEGADLPPAPVSRAKLKTVQEALAAHDGAVGAP